jgi:hyperosmotically inducible periplasmic protein
MNYPKKVSGNSKKDIPTNKGKNMKKITYRRALTVALAAMFFISVPLFASEMDDRIEVSAKQSYVFKTYLKGDDINVQSKDGVVTLTGVVSEGYYKKLAEETVANLPGVVSVNNRIEEKGEVLFANTDALIIYKVKSTLWFHRNVNATETEVYAKEGTVTLRGKATSAAQKDLTTEYAKDVEGVKDVKNEMTVSTDPMIQDPKTMSEKMDVVTESIDDISITAMVKTTLMYHRSTSALKTTVSTKDGVVYLGGNAKNAAEKDLATKLVSDVHGVNMVVNNMIVEGIKTN